MPNVRSKVTRVAMPSANVSRAIADDARPGAPGTGDGIGASRLDADDLGLAAKPRAHQAAAAGAAAAADWHEHDLDVRHLVEDLEGVGRDAGNQVRLVRRMDVAQTIGALQFLDVLARLIEVAAELDDVGAERAHRGVLVRVVAERHDDRARHAFTLARERDRLTVVAGRRGDDAAAFVGRQSSR